MRRVAVIGAGAAGLASARWIAEAGLDCQVFEMGSQLGGTWVYTDDVGEDQYGFPVYSAMYKNLRTNLPKEVMGFPDFPIPDHDGRSYLTQAEILDFLNQYADHFNIRRFIQFNRMVMEIRPFGTTQWQITTVDKPTKTEIVDIFDAVMICNGHYNDPTIPTIQGIDQFAGTQLHSHQYRSPEPFKNRRVLVIGAGPSGLDLALHMSTVAQYVVLSHHLKEAENTPYPGNVTKKPDVQRVKDHEEVEFVDGSCCRFDTIIYCTGYKYSFPFLHDSCGIKVEDNHIESLYKHMVKIDRATMCFIGVPFNVCAFQMFDLQARWFAKYLDGSMSLPSEEMMRMHAESDLQKRLDLGYSKRQTHLMGPFQQEYYEDLANDAKTASIAPVIIKLRDASVQRLYDDLMHFRLDKYKIVDSQNYIKVL